MKTVGTKLDNSEYEIFEFCCNENGLSKSEQLRDLIKDFVNDETEPNESSTPVPITEGKIIGVISDSGEVKEVLNPRISFD